MIDFTGAKSPAGYVELFHLPISSHTQNRPDESWDGNLAVIEKPFWRFINGAAT